MTDRHTTFENQTAKNRRTNASPEGNVRTWRMVLIRYDDAGQEKERLSVRGDALGELLGEALNAGIRWGGDDSPGPMAELADLLHVLTANWASFQAEVLVDLLQAIRQYEDADDGGRQVLREIMARIAQSAD